MAATEETLDSLCLRTMELSNDWLQLNKALETALREGWLWLARARTEVGHAAAAVAASPDARDAEAALTVGQLAFKVSEAADGGLSVSVDAEARKAAPKPFGPLQPRSAKQATASFVRAAELGAQLVGVRANLAAVRDRYAEARRDLAQAEERKVKEDKVKEDKKEPKEE